MNWATLERTYPYGRPVPMPRGCRLILNSDQRTHILLGARAFAHEVGRRSREAAAPLIANVMPQVELMRTSP
jgi:hypothetical protein